jgi:hypothetical protein
MKINEGWVTKQITFLLHALFHSRLKTAWNMGWHGYLNLVCPMLKFVPEFYSVLISNILTDKGCHMISVTDPYGRSPCFSRLEQLPFFHVALQLYSRG